MNTAVRLFDLIKERRFEREPVLRIVSIVAATTLVYKSCWYLFSKNNRQDLGLKDIPVPSPCYPLIGHSLSLGEALGPSTVQWHKKHGPIIKLLLGNRVWISISDPVLAHKVFVTNGASTSFRPHSNFSHKYYSGGGKNIAHAQPGEIWKRNRLAALSILKPQEIDNYLSSINKESLDMVHRLIDHTNHYGGVDPSDFLKLNFMNVIFGHCFGKVFDSVDNEEFIEIASLVENSIKYLALEFDVTNFLPFLSWFSFLTGDMKNEIETNMNKKRNPLFKQYMKETIIGEGYSFAKALHESEFDLTEDDQLFLLCKFELVVAGTDTLFITTDWICAIMPHYPDVQAKVHAELDQFISIHGRIPTFSERGSVPYCFAVIRECMRFKSVAYFCLAHSVIEDVFIDGFLFPKDSIVTPNMMSMHQSPEFYKNPEKFMPERFLSNEKSMHSSASGKIEERDIFSFGWGRRICVGMHLAETELFYTFNQIFAHCAIEPISLSELPDLENFENAGLSAKPHAFKVKFVKRSNALN